MELKMQRVTWKCDKCGYETTFEVVDDGTKDPLPEVLSICGIANSTGLCDGDLKLQKEK